MFLNNLYPKGQGQFMPGHCIEMAWEIIGSEHSIQAGLVAKVDPINETIKIVSGYQIPKEPFNGVEHPILLELVQDCFSKFPKAHYHAISQLKIAAVLPRLSHKVAGVIRVLFIPVTAYGSMYIFMGFPHLEAKEKSVTAEILNNVDRLLCFISSQSASTENIEHIRVTELFVKEVGHDIASSVQAIISKLRTIRDRRVSDPESLNRKVNEIEREINNAYAIADMLGLAIDTKYRMRSFADFDVKKSVDEAIAHLSAEAQERNVKFEVTSNSNGQMMLWGDERAIQQCFMQLFLNAVKYCFGGTFIKIGILERGDSVMVQVTNKGHELPRGDEAKDIWNFGVRGKKAKELHVNGSGIGLFTVRKIVIAHCGQAWANGNSEITTFSVSIPKREQLKKALDLLC
jgi:signal transduction histidine kinase